MTSVIFPSTPKSSSFFAIIDESFRRSSFDGLVDTGSGGLRISRCGSSYPPFFRGVTASMSGYRERYRYGLGFSDQNLLFFRNSFFNLFLIFFRPGLFLFFFNAIDLTDTGLISMSEDRNKESEKI